MQRFQNITNFAYFPASQPGEGESPPRFPSSPNFSTNNLGLVGVCRSRNVSFCLSNSIGNVMFQFQLDGVDGLTSRLRNVDILYNVYLGDMASEPQNRLNRLSGKYRYPSKLKMQRFNINVLQIWEGHSPRASFL